jgi:enoyl-CoA hydratase
MNYLSLKTRIEDHVAFVSFNRPEKANSLNETSWKEIEALFDQLDKDPEVRVVVLQGEGRHFCAGMDLSVLMAIRDQNQDDCEGRMREKIRNMILGLQAPINAIERCAKPVIAAIHGGCIGAGVDLICACDMRYATEDAFFTIKEIDMGMVADLGTLQRLPKLIGDGRVREMAYTGRKVSGLEAEKTGLVNSCYPDLDSLNQAVAGLAATIASKSPLSIRGTKEMIRYSRDHSVEDGLNYVATWNAAMILSGDLNEAFRSVVEKRTPNFKGI